MNFLIIPSRPTPNGSLHLGHMAGPYLRADILKRALNRQGHRASIILSMDVYDSYVEFDAFSKKKKYDEYCTENGKKICADMKYLDISYDKYVDPLAPEINMDLQSIADDIYQTLVKKKCLITKETQRLYDINTHRYLYGAWVQGQCQICKKNMQGSFCENCFNYCDPEQMLKLKSAIVLEPIVQRKIHLPYLQQKLNTKDWQRLVLNLRKFRQHHRLSPQRIAKVTYCEKSQWGIKGNNDLIYTPALHLLIYCLKLGDIYADMFNTINPFRNDSKTKTIAFAGVDSLMRYQYLLPALTTAYGKAKQFDYYIFNQFLLLDGEKFSKSRKHAIWVNDLKTANLTSDYIRYFLSHLDMEKKQVNFDSSKFYHDATRNFTRFIETMNHALSIACNNTLPLNEPIKNKINNLFAKQNKFLVPENFFPEKSIEIADKFFELFPNLLNTSEIKTWLFGIGELYQPFLPHLAMRIAQLKSNREQEKCHG